MKLLPRGTCWSSEAFSTLAHFSTINSTYLYVYATGHHLHQALSPPISDSTGLQLHWSSIRQAINSTSHQLLRSFTPPVIDSTGHQLRWYLTPQVINSTSHSFYWSSAPLVSLFIISSCLPWSSTSTVINSTGKQLHWPSYPGDQLHRSKNKFQKISSSFQGGSYWSSKALSTLAHFPSINTPYFNVYAALEIYSRR